MRYESFLSSVHDTLQPRAYLEVGVSYGKSLALARCRTVGIDPAYQITHEIDVDVALFRTTSDEYFTRTDPLAPTGGVPFDLSFLDGLHLLENALRDFINAERWSSPASLIIFDDILPRSVEEASRERHTYGWTGDVYPILEILAQYRPDLTVVPVGTLPTGLLLVAGLDPENTVLSDRFTDIVAEFRRPDPQPVPYHILERLGVAAPRRVLDSGLLDLLRNARASSGTGTADAVAELIAAELGDAYAPRAVQRRTNVP